MVALAANAECEVTFHIDDPTHVTTLSYLGTDYTFDETGTITFTTEVTNYGNLATVSPWAFTKASYSIVDGQKQESYFDYSEDYHFYIEGKTRSTVEFFLVTADVNEVRTKSCKVNINGSPDNFYLQFSGTYIGHWVDNLQEGENTLNFRPGENTVAIASDPNKPVCEVALNGVKCTGIKGNYIIEINEDNVDVIDINTVWPDKDVTVTINYEGDASAACITDFTISGEKVADFSKPVKAKIGQVINIDCRNSNYTTDYLKINGQEQDWTFYEGILTEDLVIDLKQTKKPCYTANVTVDDYTRIKYALGYYDTYYYPTSNTFTVEKAQDSSGPVTFYAIDTDCLIDKCTADGVEVELEDHKQGKTVYLKENVQDIVITTRDIERPNQFMFYYNSPEKALSIYGITDWLLSSNVYGREGYYKEELQKGYNMIDFGPDDGEFRFILYGDMDVTDKCAHFYKNNELLPSVGYEMTSWYFTPENNDVIKAFIVEKTPKTYEVSFSVEDEGAVEEAYVDIVREVEITDETVLTEIQETGVILNVDEDYVVIVDGEEIAPANEPMETVKRLRGKVYVLDVLKDMNVKIVKRESGISGVTVSEKTSNPAVYNLLGVKVSDGSTDNLPAGLYIQKGQKIYVK